MHALSLWRHYWPALTALMLALVQSLRLWWHRAQPRWALQARALRGAAGEELAESLLLDHGYRVEARQATRRWIVLVDGRESEITLRADWIVQRHGRRLVADVKTGREAPRIESAATRRQLLEYRLAFDVDGVLLVDAESGRIHEIEFALPDGKKAQPLWELRLIWLALGLALGLGAVLFR